jgi:hypothetical protein
MFPALVLLCSAIVAAPLLAQEKLDNQANEPAAPPAKSADLITVPDGMPVQTKLTQQISSATAKVGDAVELTVAKSVRVEDGLVIIPKGTVFSGRVTEVVHARRGSRYGSVTFTVEKFVFPGGESAALGELAPKESAGKKVRTAASVTAHVALDPEFDFMGLPMMAIFGPVLLVEKGHETVYYPRSITTLHIHGPVYLQREAVLNMQLPPYEGPAQVTYGNRGGEEAAFNREFYCGQIHLGDIPVNGTVRFELNPGAYWLSVGTKGEKVRLEVQANHQYYVERGSHGLVIKDFRANQDWLDSLGPPFDIDFTVANPQTAAALTAEPPPAKTAPGVH